MNYTKLFAERLTELSNEKNKSINQISKECGIKQQTLSTYTTANREIKLSYLWTLADYFNISIDELVGRI